MPISLPPLPPLSRRRFLGSIAAGMGLVAGRHLYSADAETDADRYFLLSDTHIAADAKAAEHGTTMLENLQQVIGELNKEEKRAASVIVNGDCAYHNGESGDYQTFLKAIEPVRQRGMPVHLTMGNHDKRENFWKEIPGQDPARKAVQDRQVTLIETPRVNWILLDSLDKTNATPGILGKPQTEWLAKTLDDNAKKPALVMVHHNPDEKPKVTGLTDTKDLLDVILPRKQVKMLFFGHTHNWEATQREGVHFVNLPAVAYVFTKGKANGWVDCQLKENSASLQIHCIDPAHKQHMEKLELPWR